MCSQSCTVSVSLQVQNRYLVTGMSQGWLSTTNIGAVLTILVYTIFICHISSIGHGNIDLVREYLAV